MNPNAVKLEVRMDRNLKEDAEAVFAELGLDANTAVCLFFTRVARTRSIPFRLTVEPEFTPEQEDRIMEACEESKNPANLSGPFETAAELLAHLHDQSNTMIPAKEKSAKARLAR